LRQSQGGLGFVEALREQKGFQRANFFCHCAILGRLSGLATQTIQLVLHGLDDIVQPL
jgi:hypothetical protein